MDRRFTFANSKVIAQLQTRFIPVVANTHEVQNQRFESSKWFLAMASSVNSRIEQHVTAQGFYIAGADGSGYGFNNNRSPDVVLSFLDRSFEKFKLHPPSQAVISESQIDAPYSRGPDPTTSVLQVYSRINPLPAGCDELNKGIGRDFFWVYADEVKQIRASILPQDLVTRLLRFHLVDNVRGEPDMWKAGQVTTQVFELHKLGPNRFAFNGRFAMSAGPRGLEGKIEGEMTLDPNADRLANFKAYAECDAWGEGTYTPSPPPGKFRLLFAIVPATAAYAKVTPPAAALYGDAEYRHPER